MLNFGNREDMEPISAPSGVIWQAPYVNITY